MNSTNGIREFLTSRRAHISPNDAVAILRAEAGRDLYHKLLPDLVGELSTRSDEFRVRWGAHNVKFHRTDAKTLRHPTVGDLTLDYEASDLPGDAGQRILVYSAEPGSRSQQALDLLASHCITRNRSDVSPPGVRRVGTARPIGVRGRATSSLRSRYIHQIPCVSFPILIRFSFVNHARAS